MTPTIRNAAVLVGGLIITTIGTIDLANADCRAGADPQGFRSITWGTPLSAVKSQFTPVPDQGPNIYSRVNDKMVIGDAPLLKIMYEFYRGSFSSTYLFSAPGTDSQMTAAFSAQFGNSVPLRAKPLEYGTAHGQSLGRAQFLWA